MVMVKVMVKVMVMEMVEVMEIEMVKVMVMVMVMVEVMEIEMVKVMVMAMVIVIVAKAVRVPSPKGVIAVIRIGALGNAVPTTDVEELYTIDTSWLYSHHPHPHPPNNSCLRGIDVMIRNGNIG